MDLLKSKAGAPGVPEPLPPTHYREKWHRLCWGLDSVSLIAFAPKPLRKSSQSGVRTGAESGSQAEG